MKRLLIVGLLVLLAACNRVQTKAPLFGPEDARGAPVLREGVWLVEGETLFLTEIEKPARCRVDVAKPTSRWPKCARWLLVRDGRLHQYMRGEGKGESGWAVQGFLIAATQPTILQTAGSIETWPVDPETEAGDPSHQYFVLAPTAADPEGRTVAFDTWPVLCGPHPTGKPGKGESARFLTRELHPGLTAEPVDGADPNNCMTTSREALLSAAAASRGWHGEPLKVRWVRDSYP